MEDRIKDLWFLIGELSWDFRDYAREEQLPPEARQAWRMLSIELDDLALQLYLASFVDNDARISELAGSIRDAGEEADQLNKELDEVTKAFKEARGYVQQATEAVGQIGEKAGEIQEKIDQVKEVLGHFGIEV